MVGFSDINKTVNEVSKISTDMPKFGENIKPEYIKDSNEANKKLSINENRNNIDSELSNEVSNFLNPYGIDVIKENYENVDKKLEQIKDGVVTATNDLELQVQFSKISKYKGIIMECIIKESLTSIFENAENNQRIIKTPEGNTKPDIVLNRAKEQFIIGNTFVNKGENLFIEVKCGEASYIRNEMKHILKQVSGHKEGKSVVVVTKDYLDISEEQRAIFEEKLAQKGSSVCVLNVYSKDIEKPIIEYIRR